MSVSPAAELLRYRQTRIDSVGRKENTPYASVHRFTNIFITESRRFMYLCGFQLLAVTKSRTETWDSGTWDAGTRGRVETRERDKQVVICWRACQ